MKMINTQRHAPFIIFVLGILLLLPSVWSETSISDKDEYWLSLRTPMEMQARGSWLTPWVNGEPRLQKPPLLYWAILITYKLFGINLLAARIWGLLAGAGLAVCSCVIYRVLFKKSGILAGLITLGSIGVVIEGRVAMLDLPLAFFTSLAVYFALIWGKSGHLKWILFSAFSLGLSFMLKGPMGFLFFAAAAVGGLYVFKKWRFVFARISHVISALALLLAVCVPWPLIMSFLWPSFFEIVGEEAGKRHLGDIYAASPLSALGGSMGLIFPWSLVLVAAIIHSLRRARSIRSRETLWLVIWYFGSTIPFFFMKSFERYMIPIIPAMCVLCANWLEEGQGPWKTALLRVTIIITGLAAILFCVFFVWFGLGLPIVALCLGLTAGMIWAAFYVKDTRVVVGAVAVLLAGLIGGLYPSLGINALPPNLNRVVGHFPVAVYKSEQPSMLSIRLGRSVVKINPRLKKGRRLLKHFDGFVFMKEADAGDFETVAAELGTAFEKIDQFKTFYSRKVWVRFARESATLADWKAAIRTHSLENLGAGIRFYRVSPGIRAGE